MRDNCKLTRPLKAEWHQAQRPEDYVLEALPPGGKRSEKRARGRPQRTRALPRHLNRNPKRTTGRA